MTVPRGHVEVAQQDQRMGRTDMVGMLSKLPVPPPGIGGTCGRQRVRCNHAQVRLSVPQGRQDGGHARVSDVRDLALDDRKPAEEPCAEVVLPWEAEETACMGLQKWLPD